MQRKEAQFLWKLECDALSITPRMSCEAGVILIIVSAWVMRAGPLYPQLLCDWMGTGPRAGLPQPACSVWVIDFLQERFHLSVQVILRVHLLKLGTVEQRRT